jgi:hypothetical protein
MTSTDGTSNPMVLEQYRNSASPAASDAIGGFYNYGNDSNLSKVLYSAVDSNIISATAGSFSGGMKFYSSLSGSVSVQLNILGTGCQVRGNNTNTASPAGYIGEVISSSVTAFSLTTGTQHNLTTISLTAGSWIISGSVGFVPAGTLTMCAAGNGSVSASFTTPGLDFAQMNGISSVAGNLAMATPTIRALLSATTTYYLVATANFSSTCTANGAIFARRIG